MKKLKHIGLVIGSLCFMLGMFGFCTSFIGSTSDTTTTFYSPRAINQVNGLAVDSNGNIYIGESEGSYIQVFDSNGVFLYGFSFNANTGWFSFGIDKGNIIHIVTARTESHLQYFDGKFIHTDKIDYKQRCILEQLYQMSEGNDFAVDNRIYKLDIFHQLKISDKTNTVIKTIPLDVPIWPFSKMVYFVIGVIGGVLFTRCSGKKIRISRLNGNERISPLLKNRYTNRFYL